MSESIRLSKAVVALKGCSRREAELYIEGGWVLVDGVVVEQPQFAIDTQKVELLPDAKAEPLEPVTLLLHKPAGEVCDPDGKHAAQLLAAEACVVEHSAPAPRMLRRHFLKLSVPMPLDQASSGLLVLTQDWGVTQRLTDHGSPLEQEYVVEVSGTIAADGLVRLNRKTSTGPWAPPAFKVSWQSETRLRFAGKGIEQEQIRQMCAGVGLQATAIRRIRIGQIAMSGLLPGQWRYLPAHKRF